MDEIEATASSGSDGDDGAPEWLGAVGRVAWSKIAPDLRAQGLLKPAEEFALARYCDTLDRWHTVRARVNARNETYVTESKHGKLERINPDFKVLGELESWLTTFEDRFALSPMFRMKLKALRQNVGEGDGPQPRPPLLTPTHTEGEPDPVPASPFGGMLN
jgi:P27 family predicted phage terminase small subunit